jgi:hypothetical protein
MVILLNTGNLSIAFGSKLRRMQTTTPFCWVQAYTTYLLSSDLLNLKLPCNYSFNNKSQIWLTIYDA